MKITTNVLTTTNQQGLTADKQQNARENIHAQVLLVPGEHVTLTDEIDEETGALIKQKIAVDGSMGGEYTAGSDYVVVNNDTHKIDLADATKAKIENGKTYTEGTGISISDTNEISIDTDYVATKDDVSKKVDKVDGKQLSTEDYTTDEKKKLSDIEDGAEANVIESITMSGSPLVPSGTTVNIPVDQTFQPKSSNPASGTALAAAVAGVIKSVSAGTDILVSADPNDSSKVTVKVNTTGEATGERAFVEGEGTKATGYDSHAEGQNTSAFKLASHAEGIGTEANGEAQHVGGKYNIPDTTSAEIIGWGTAGEHKNIRKLDTEGNETIAGDLFYKGSRKVSDLEAVMTAATSVNAGKVGRVPAPPIATTDPKVLTDDASWTTVHEYTVDETDTLLGWVTTTEETNNG